MPREELKSRLKLKSAAQARQAVGARGTASSKTDLPTRLFAFTLRKLVAEAAVKEAGPLILRPGHAIRMSQPQKEQVDNLLRRFAAAPYAPPSVKETLAEVGEDLYTALVELGELVPMRAGGGAPDVVFQKEDYERMISEIRSLIAANGAVTAAQVRDHFNTSRRYVLALLEHLDAIGVTVREGEARRLK
jgi:selenocysteine-specific elongation factor